MGLYLALVVASCGVALYAVAALAWDRRRPLGAWCEARRPGRGAAPRYLVAGSLVGGSGLLVVSAALAVTSVAQLCAS